MAHLVTTPQAKDLITALFFQMNQVKAGASRPPGIERSKVTKLGILGTGMMGQGIAYVAAAAGIPVVLRDLTVEGAEKGRGPAMVRFAPQRVTRIVSGAAATRSSSDIGTASPSLDFTMTASATARQRPS